MKLYCYGIHVYIINESLSAIWLNKEVFLQHEKSAAPHFQSNKKAMFIL